MLNIIIMVFALWIPQLSNAFISNSPTLITPIWVKTQQAITERINLNQADEAKLVKLKGIGPKRAHAIIDYRKEHGIFKTIEELHNIKGIGNKLLQKIKKYLYV